MGVKSHAFVLKAQRIGSKIAVKGGPENKPRKGRRYHIHALYPNDRGEYVVLVKDPYFHESFEAPEECFDWSKPWFESGPRDPVDVEYLQAVRRDARYQGSAF